MNSLQKSLKVIKKAEELKNPDILAVNILNLEEKVEEIKEIADNTRKQKGETGNTGEKGDNGDRGEKGEQGIKGDRGEKGDKGERGNDGKNGINGVNGLNGIDGVDGKDGSPDTGEQIVSKINEQKTLIERSKIKDLDKDIKELKERQPVINNIIQGQGSASGIRDIRAGTNISITKVNDVYTVNSTASSETPSLQEVTDVGATTTNDISVPDEVYGAGWNGSMEVPTKNALYDKIETIVTSPAGSDTQVQFNDSGAFGGDANFTWNKTTKVLTLGASSLDARLVTHAIKSDASDGLLIEANNGTDVGLLGAGNTANVVWYGNHNYNTATASTLASFGASKTLQSASVGSTLSFSANTLGLNLANANTWTGQQTFNTSATVHGVGMISPKWYPSADSTNAMGLYKANGTTQIMYVDTTNSRIGIGASPTAYSFELRSASNIAAWIGTPASSFGYTLGRNTGTGYLDILGNQSGFSGLQIDSLRVTGTITAGGNAVISNWASTLGLGAGSGAASSVLEIRGSTQDMLIGGGTGYSYKFQRNSGTGFMEITGQQSGYTGFIINPANGANALTINDGGSVGMGVAIGSIGAKLHIIKTTEQLRIGYDASNRMSLTVGSTGGVTFDAVGSGAGFTFSDSVTVNGNLTLGTTGNKINITTGSNASAGTATLVAGTVTVNTTAVTANSIIMLTRQTTAGTLGTSVDVTARVAGTSFTITANGSVLDTSTVGWVIIN